MQIALTYIKKKKTLLNVSVLIKAKVKYCFSPIRLAKIPKLDCMYVDEAERKQAVSNIALGNAVW